MVDETGDEIVLSVLLRSPPRFNTYLLTGDSINWPQLLNFSSDFLLLTSFYILKATPLIAIACHYLCTAEWFLSINGKTINNQRKIFVNEVSLFLRHHLFSITI